MSGTPRRHRKRRVELSRVKTTIRHYRLLSLLGQGGMGTVYLAEHTAQKHRVALKVLQPQFSADMMAVQRFWQEYQTLRSLNHNNIVRVYEFGEWQGCYFIATEYIQGTPLDTLLDQRHHFSLKQTVTIIQQIANALDAAHQRGIVHRDLKPANVLQERGGRIVLTDFGIASILGRNSHLTKTGQITGTCAYMSPEQVEPGRPLTYLADIYAMGVLAYRMLAGRVPFEGENQWVVLHAHLHNQPPPLHTAGVPAAVENVVFRALRKLPEQRPKSAGEFATQLANAAGLPARVATPGRQRSASRRPFPVLWISLAGTLLIAFLAAPLLTEFSQSQAAMPESPWTLAYTCGERGDNLCLVDDTGTRQILGNGSQTWNPVWSPDGRSLAFASNRSDRMDIWVLDLESETTSRLNSQSEYPAYSPSWSPDGTAVVFDQDVEGVYGIYSQYLGSTARTRLTSVQSSNSDPDWSPTGEHIAFVSNRDGDLEIYMMDSDGRNVTRLTAHPGDDFAPIWSPDGKWIAYECEDLQRDNIEICTMNAAGGEQRTLTQNLFDDRQPAWSPDGKYIAFTRQRPHAPQWDIWVMRQDGSEEQVLIQGQYSSTHPAWKP